MSDRNLDLNAVDNHTSTSNYTIVFARFVIGDIVLQISKVEDRNDTPYLMLRVDHVYTELATTVHGIVLQAKLGGIQLIDKVHTGIAAMYKC